MPPRRFPAMQQFHAMCSEGGGGGGGSNRLPGLVTEQQAVEFPQVLAIVYMKMRATEFSAQPYYYDVHY